MKLGSAIQMPFNLDFNLFKSSPIACFSNVSTQFHLQRRSFSGVCACGGKRYCLAPVSVLLKSSGRFDRRTCDYSRIICARRTEDEQEASTSRDSRESSRSRSLDGMEDNESSCDDASSANEGEMTSKNADYGSSLSTVALCVFSAVAFGVGLGFKDGMGKATEFFAGYLLEQSLSVDNLFVFVLIFKYFKVPFNYQNRVLSYGIAGAIVFRSTLILLGTATLQRFEAVNLFLATILLYSSFKLFAEEDEYTDLSDNFIVKTCQKFIPVTSNYDGNRFITIQDGIWKGQSFWAGYTFAPDSSCY